MSYTYSLTHFIVDLERTRVSESVVFWRAGCAGYTVDFDDAGLYTQEEAERVASNRDKHNIAVPREAICHDMLTRILPKSILKTALKVALAPEAI